MKLSNNNENGLEKTKSFQKIAISSEGNTLESMIDQRFGRCKYFLVIEVENNKIKDVKAVENQGALQGHGAGIRAAQQVGEMRVKEIITGQLGPNATNVLEQLGITVYHASGTVKNAVGQLIKGNLNKITEIASDLYIQSIKRSNIC